MKETFEKLLSGECLERSQAREILKSAAQNGMPSSGIAALLTVFSMRPITQPELAGFRDAMLELALPLELEGLPAIDLCGTGGDGKNTFNISTVAAFVVAAAGIPVTKHGNYASSSVCGSSNLLEALGVPLPATAESARQCLSRTGIVFLHAPFWHPAMKLFGPVRKELGFRTFFNFLGPLVNPARPPFQFTGVCSRDIQALYAGILSEDLRNFSIVHSLDGYDEISLTGQAEIMGPAGTVFLSPSVFGLDPVKPEEIGAGATPEQTVAIALAILADQATPAQTNVVLANAACAIQTADPAFSLGDCLMRAKEALVSGRAEAVLRKLQEEKLT